MSRPGTWPKRAIQVAGVAALLCTFAFSQTPAPTSTSSKSAKKSTPHKSSSKAAASTTAAHHAPSTAKSKGSSAHAVSHKSKGRKSGKSYRRGQQKIDNSRTVQIQEALIKQHYLKGEASGKWDASTEEALRRYQGDNGWQNKTVPDSRALIKLGLGPSHDHLLNPESAMTTAPEPQTPRVGKPSAGPSEPTPSTSQPN